MAQRLESPHWTGVDKLQLDLEMCSCFHGRVLLIANNYAAAAADVGVAVAVAIVDGEAAHDCDALAADYEGVAGDVTRLEWAGSKINRLDLGPARFWSCKEPLSKFHGCFD